MHLPEPQRRRLKLRQLQQITAATSGSSPTQTPLEDSHRFRTFVSSILPKKNPQKLVSELIRAHQYDPAARPHLYAMMSK